MTFIHWACYMFILKQQFSCYRKRSTLVTQNAALLLTRVELRCEERPQAGP